MCESVRLRSVNDMCRVVMQRRIATLKDRKVGNLVNIRTYKCEVHIFSFALWPSILYKAKQKLIMWSKFRTPYLISIYQKWHMSPLLTIIWQTNSLCTRGEWHNNLSLFSTWSFFLVSLRKGVTVPSNFFKCTGLEKHKPFLFGPNY